MRQVLSLSLPATDVQHIKSLAKKRGFESLSTYVKYLFKADEDLISESDLLTAWQEARKEYRAGKSIQANSIADLI